MEVDCIFWNYCLGSTSVVLLLSVIILSILLICSRRKTSKIKSAFKKLKLDIESGGETESKRQEMDALKIALKQGTPLPTPKGDNIENVYETIKPKENTLLAVRDSVSVRLKNKILNRKGRNKIVTFSSEQFEVIPNSLEQITSEDLDERSHSMSDIIEDTSTEEFATNRPSTSRKQVESTYMPMHGSQKSNSEVNLNQTIEKSREPSHVYAKCQKPPPLPRGSSVAKLNPQYKGTLENKPVSSNSQSNKSEHDVNKAIDDEILNTDCEDDLDEDEMYNREIEKYTRALESSSTSSVSSKVKKETSNPKFMDKDSKPILPKKLSLKSQSGLLGVEHRIDDLQNKFVHDATSLESYDVPPAPRPVTTITRSGNELISSTPYCGRKILYNSPSPSPSRKSNISETSISSKTPKKSKMMKKLKKMEELINKSLRWKPKQDEDLDSSKSIGSLVQNSFYNPTGSNPKFPTEERKPSLSDINRLQARLNMTNTSSDRFSTASSIATPPILRRTSSVSQANDDDE